MEVSPLAARWDRLGPLMRRSRRIALLASAAVTGIVVAGCGSEDFPNDPRPPKVTSGIRLGTAALTTRGLKEQEMREVAGFIDRAMGTRKDQEQLHSLRE